MKDERSRTCQSHSSQEPARALVGRPPSALTQAAGQEGLKLEVIELDVNDPDSAEQAVRGVLIRPDGSTC